MVGQVQGQERKALALIKEGYMKTVWCLFHCKETDAFYGPNETLHAIFDSIPTKNQLMECRLSEQQAEFAINHGDDDDIPDYCDFYFIKEINVIQS